MPILLVLFVTAACLPVPWPAPPFDLGAGGAAALTGGLVLGALTCAAILRTWAVRAITRDTSRRAEVMRVYGRLRRLLGLANLALAGVAVAGLGWGWAVQSTLVVAHDGYDVLAPFAELAVPLPYFAALFGGWVLYYDAERALHPPGGRPFRSRAGYVFAHVRFLALMVGVPVGLYAGQQSLARYAPELAGTDGFRLAMLGVLPLFILVMPLLAKPLLGLKPLPPGPTRARLEALARRLKFRYADILLWPTHGTMANAFIAGLIPPARYVVFTDRILDEFPPDEVDAIFGHEVGHQRHGHLWLYAAFILLSVVVLTAAGLWALKTFGATWFDPTATDAPWWLALPPVGLAAGYIFLVFGFLSRRCERQADVFGCRAVSCGNPDCSGHDPDTVVPAGGLCPTGVRTFVRALERVEHLHGPDDPAPRRAAARALRGVMGWVRAWQHGPIRRRVGFLLGLIDHPGRERRFQRGALLVRAGLLAALLAALVVLGDAIGWRTLLAAL